MRENKKSNLPEGWKTKKLNDLCVFIRGVSFGKADAQNRPDSLFIPILRAGNISERLDTIDDLIYIPRKYIHPNQMLKKGDIVICLSSGSSDLVGKSAILEEEFEGSVGVFCGIIRSKDLRFSRYISFWLRSNDFWNWRDSKSSGTNIQNLKFAEMVNIEIPLPPTLDDQTAIANELERKMSEVNKIRQATERQLEAIEALPGAILREVFDFEEK